MSTADVTVTSIAKYTPPSPAGLIGLNGISVHDNFFLGSYSSGTTTTPTQGTSSSNGLIESNGVIGGHSGDNVHGAVTLGPSGSINTITYTGTKTIQGTAITGPTVTMQNVTNPSGYSDGVTPNLANNTTQAWPGGTYYFTSFTLNDGDTITFTGPATIYLNGSASIHDNDSITAYNGIPSNLVVYQASGNTFVAHDHFNYTGELIAPGSDYTVHDNGNTYGSIFAQSATIHDGDNFFCDSAISGGAAGITTVK